MKILILILILLLCSPAEAKRLIIFGDSNSGGLVNAITSGIADGAFRVPGSWTFLDRHIAGEAAGLPSPAPIGTVGRANVQDAIDTNLVQTGDIAFICYGTVDALNEALRTYPQFGVGAADITAVTAAASVLEMAAAVNATGAKAVVVRPVGIRILPHEDYASPAHEDFWAIISAGSRTQALLYAGYPRQISYYISQTKPENWNADLIHLTGEPYFELALRINVWMKKNEPDWSN